MAAWAAPPLARAPWLLVAALTFVGFADEWFTFFPAGALEPMARDLGLAYAHAGAVLVALSAGGLVGFTFEIAADYVSRRLLAAAGALAYGAAMIAFGLADSLWVLLGAAFVWGAASDAFTHGCEVALVDLSGEDLARSLGRMNAWSAVGDLLAPTSFALALALGWGWRTPFVVGGALMLAYAAWLAAQRFPAPNPPEAHPNPLSGVWAVVRDGRVLLLGTLMGLFALLDEPLLGFTIAYLESVAGFGAAAATALALGAVGGAVGGYLAADRVGRDLSLPAVLGATAVAMAAFLPLMAFAAWPAAILAAGAGFGAASAIFYTRLQEAVMTLRPGQAGSTGAIVSVIGLPGAAFPALAGAAADAWGLAAAIATYAVVPVAVLALVLAFRRSIRGA
ncbi:MAG: MFS transporter [Phenylobacterium sp.]|uniref:MFS transporter n=1 Tax=Phenylobacterium sp. TaxID=1871053 RepID=UPI00391BF80D